MATEVKIPDIGDYKDVPIIEVHVSEGDTVNADDPLVSLESDKATMEVPAPAAGIVEKLLIKLGDKVSEGRPIILLRSADAAAAPAPPSLIEQQEPTPAAQPPAAGGGVRREAERAPRGPRRFQPHSREPERAPARARARRRSFRAEGDRRKGQDHQGRRQGRPSGPGRAGLGPRAGGRRGHSGDPGRRLLEVRSDRDHAAAADQEDLRPASASRLAERATRYAPGRSGHHRHRAYRKELDAAAKEKGYRVTLLAFLMKAAVSALKAVSRFNASLCPEKDALILKRYYHIGVAVDTPEGLVVPVVRDVDRKGVGDISQELGAVSKKARDGKLGAADMQGASFTISSLGGIGGTAFTPLVNAPEVAILGVVRSRMAPIWDGQAFQPRLMLPLSVSYDHRVIDGALAARFTRHLAHVLEDVRRLVL